VRQARPPLTLVLFLLTAYSSAISGQDAQRTSTKVALAGLVTVPPLVGPAPWPVPQQALSSSSTHAHKLAGFAAGVTLGAAVMSLDAVIGSGCIGSGDYLLRCRAGLVGGSLLAGGLGALVGAFVRTDEVRGRSTRILVGSALGAVGAFLVSTVTCSQEDESNPAFLCGFDGMVETAPVVVAAVTGGTVGALTGRQVESPRMVRLAAVPGGGIALDMRATISWR
jgi:hypothetical protein